MDLQLRGRTALVTGAANGIGRATAGLFAQEGCTLILWDIAPEVHSVARQIGELQGVRVRADQVDIQDGRAMQSLFKQYLDDGWGLDHVVHCAAVGSGKFGFPFSRLDPEDWAKPLAVNIMGMVQVAHTFSGHFRQQRRGTFVFLSSVAGQIGSQTDPPYSASKAANINFVQCMAKDLAADGVRVNTVCPGMVATPLNRSVWEAWTQTVPTAEQLPYELWAQRKIQTLIPLQRGQSCEDIANMIVFLSSDRSAQVTGQAINVDGGYMMH